MRDEELAGPSGLQASSSSYPRPYSVQRPQTSSQSGSNRRSWTSSTTTTAGGEEEGLMLRAIRESPPKNLAAMEPIDSVTSGDEEAVIEAEDESVHSPTIAPSTSRTRTGTREQQVPPLPFRVSMIGRG